MKLARKYRSRRRSSGEPRRNPPFIEDMKSVVIPGFVAFGAARFATRMLTIAVNKRWPKLARHAGALAGAAVFGGAYVGSQKIKALEKYSEGIILGSGIGALVTIVQTYLPKLGWVFSEVAPSELQPGGAAGQLGSGELDEGEWGFYNDAYSGGRYNQAPAQTPAEMPARAMSAAAAETAKQQNAVDEFLAEMAQEPGGGGIFAGGIN